MGSARRAALRLHLVPCFEGPTPQDPARPRAERPPWSEPMPLIVEFGRWSEEMEKEMSQDGCECGCVLS